MGEFDKSEKAGETLENQEPSSNEQQAGAPAVVKQSTSGLAIAGLVLGILAILTSFIPIINNGSFFLALIGTVLAIVGFLGVRKGKHTGKGIAVAGIVLGIASIVIVLVTQSMFSAAIDAATPGIKSVGSASASAAASGEAASAASASSSAAQASSSTAASSQSDAKDYQSLAVGETITMKSGLKVTVHSIAGGLSNYNGNELVCVNVTYLNEGSKNASFGPYDWKVEDPDGAQSSMTFFMNGENELKSGSLSAGGTTTGNIYFDAPAARIHYYANMFDDSSLAAWVA